MKLAKGNKQEFKEEEIKINNKYKKNKIYLRSNKHNMIGSGSGQDEISTLHPTSPANYH